MSICVYDSLPDEAVEIRENVFVKEQGFEKEFDEIDEKAIHLVMFDEHLQKPVATCRIYEGSKPSEFILGRLAVVLECRGMNLGSDMKRLFGKKAVNRFLCMHSAGLEHFMKNLVFVDMELKMRTKAVHTAG